MDKELDQMWHTILAALGKATSTQQDFTAECMPVEDKSSSSGPGGTETTSSTLPEDAETMLQRSEKIDIEGDGQADISMSSGLRRCARPRIAARFFLSSSNER